MDETTEQRRKLEAASHRPNTVAVIQLLYEIKDRLKAQRFELSTLEPNGTQIREVEACIQKIDAMLACFSIW